VLFGVTVHVALLLEIRFGVSSAPPAAAFVVVALAPLIASSVRLVTRGGACPVANKQ